MEELKVRFYGTRGSLPICDPEFLEFGGNTTCIAVYREDLGTISILDAGTGIRKLGKVLKQDFPEQKEVFIAFSHFHWDHIQGLPFFEPAYDPEMKINILAMGEGRKYTNLYDIFATQMDSVYFPVPLNQMGCEFDFQVEEGNITGTGGASVKALKQNHPGGSYGYRYSLNGKVVVICTDLEHGERINQDVVEFARGADLLIHEAQYTTAQLQRHLGWGHSSFEQAIEVAEQAEVKQLIMTHHDPDHDDNFLRQIERQCKERFPNCALAREGVEFSV